MRFSLATLLIITAVSAVCIKYWTGASPPSMAQWRQESPPDGSPFLDECYAYEHFYGKSLRDAELLFQENSMYYYEDLLWMPDECFQFYVVAYCNYLLSDASEYDSDGASCFFSTVELQHEAITSGGLGIIRKIEAVLDRLETNQSWYGASVEIYGDFRERAAKCRALISRSRFNNVMYTEPRGSFCLQVDRRSPVIVAAR